MAWQEIAFGCIFVFGSFEKNVYVMILASYIKMPLTFLNIPYRVSMDYHVVMMSESVAMSYISINIRIHCLTRVRGSIHIYFPVTPCMSR